MFLLNLAESLGMTVGHLLTELSGAELMEWRALHALRLEQQRHRNLEARARANLQRMKR